MSVLMEAAKMPLSEIVGLTGLEFPAEAKQTHRAFMRWLAENDRHETYGSVGTAWRTFWANISVAEKETYGSVETAWRTFWTNISVAEKVETFA